ncbi:GDP-mannose transporter into the lumen of the Golgi [Terramyces sp. JEL0728]|nr:GDP-mannose transporter into the lumen of the Golgi [Terramyces sp. JEL0728]
MSTSPILPILSYCAASIMMTLTNKLVLSGFDFKLNFLFLFVQNAGCLILLIAITKLGLVTPYRAFNQKDALVFLRVAVALVFMIYTGSKALQYLSVPVFTIFKNLTIILTAYMERWLLSGSAVSTPIFVSFMLMVLSSVVAGYADIVGQKQVKESAGFAVSYGWMALNCITTTTFTLLLKGSIKKVNFKEYDTMYFNNLLSLPILFAFFLLNEWSEATKTYDRYFGSTSEEYASEFNTLMVGMVISSVCTFAISFASSWCVRITGATTYSMVGALNKLPIAVFGMVFFDAVISFASVSGILIAFVAGALYSWAKSQPTRPTLPVYNPVKDKDEE